MARLDDPITTMLSRASAADRFTAQAPAAVSTEAEDLFCLLAVPHKDLKPPKAGRSPVGTSDNVRKKLLLPSNVQVRKAPNVLARIRFKKHALLIVSPL